VSNEISDAIRRAASRMSDEPDEPDTSAGCVDYNGWRRDAAEGIRRSNATSPSCIRGVAGEPRPGPAALRHEHFTKGQQICVIFTSCAAARSALPDRRSRSAGNSKGREAPVHGPNCFAGRGRHSWRVGRYPPALRTPSKSPSRSLVKLRAHHPQEVLVRRSHGCQLTRVTSCTGPPHPRASTCSCVPLPPPAPR
jgi:hypothetical protein